MTQKSHLFENETVSLHGGQHPDKATGSRAVPIYQTTSYVFNDTEHAKNLFSLAEPGNIYTRLGNPTVDVFEQRVALLEDGVAAVATSSGMSAITLAILNIASAGDEIVASTNLYGGTYNLFAVTLPKYGINVTFVDSTDPEQFRDAITSKTKAIFAEVIGNPSLHVLDIESVADIAHDYHIPLIVDSTFATPILCKPLSFGADIVVHSATKWIGGHGTSIGGVVVDGGRFDWNHELFPGFTEPDESYHGLRYGSDVGPAGFAVKLRVQLLRDIGACLSPHNAFHLLQGLETLHLRIERHVQNAKEIALYLENHPGVSWVSYPGLPSHPSHSLAQKYLNQGAGSMVVFGIKGGLEEGKRAIDHIKLWSHVANVGDAKSLIIHPASTTHQQLNNENLVKTGVTEDLIRLSVGIESTKDLIEDLEQAIYKATGVSSQDPQASGASSYLQSSLYRDETAVRPKKIVFLGNPNSKDESSKLSRLGFKLTDGPGTEADIVYVTEKQEGQVQISPITKLVAYRKGTLTEEQLTYLREQNLTLLSTENLYRDAIGVRIPNYIEEPVKA
ncbi:MULTISPECIES: O-acetylhomoserine aminocarboxypropyltransferase/cysteine synthase family protein [Pontibacillus]|uniref:O-acetylhomoserine aminocarboxypropyltransferase/cysteine synthase n=1 Tax=Pontibacillus chungwhensis TaxID=265426 RepID=A0ABY8UVK9_9BACI|nr:MULTISPECIES: O-acetylhomoserine aminocarboxypropyltransferase/cysteine synthase family protein [Pontibacillus]MCD5323151.1 O-acetylhomoserine aminocarboxypropyltransferase/cysteine synthase [Pontibacillus sp. HN14]WIF96539.1 O-acetylhomoserine aminocarboxypropyltransferase/cysteine synthase [Pontibacillus chungwhensis]